MKKHFYTIILILVFVVGLSVLLYPSISNYYNSIHQSHAIANYDSTVNNISEDNYEKILADAKAYNESIAKQDSLYFRNGEPFDDKYKSLLDIGGDGIMGYINIKRLDVLLPIYHGTSEGLLAEGAGHLEGSSLPIGGKNTNAVITGHRGLPSSKLFTDLDQLGIGDTFTITVLNETLTYEVDDIKIVLPEEANNIDIVPNEDHVTLVTCTPYAVNTHRLLVRGIRTKGPNVIRVSADAMQIDTMIVAPIVAAPVFFVLFIVLMFGGRNKKKKAKKYTNKTGTKPKKGKDFDDYEN